MLVDLESAWLDLKALIGSKSHHGQRDLLAEMARLEVAHRVSEALPEKALRLYGLEFYSEAVAGARSGSDSSQARVSAVNGRKAPALRDDSHNESEEDTDGRRARHSQGAEGSRPTAAGSRLLGTARH